MDRHAVRDRRAPGGVGAGVEVGLHLEGGEPAVCVGGRLRPDARRMALGGRGHRLGAADRRCAPAASSTMRGDREQRLHRDVELAAEAAAAGGRADAHLPRARRRARARSPRGPCRAPACRRETSMRSPIARRRSPPPARYRRARRRRSRTRPRRSTAPCAWPRGDIAASRDCRASGHCPARAAWSAARRRPSAASMPESGAQRRPGDRQVGVARCFRPPRACRPAPAPPRRGSARCPARAPAGPADAAKMPKEFSPGTSSAVRIATRPGDARARTASRSPSVKRRARMRRAHDAHPERSRPARRRRRRGPCPRPSASRRRGGGERRRRAHLPACGAMRARSSALALAPTRHVHITASTIFTIAGAAAEHAAERVLDRARDWRRVACVRQSAAAISMPGVQMPHCAAPCARNAARSRSVTPSGPAPRRCDRRAVRLRGRDQAGADLLAVHQHGAGAAIAGVAADLGAGQAELVAQRVGERGEGRRRRRSRRSPLTREARW